jgi:hypothetical protein
MAVSIDGTAGEYVQYPAAKQTIHRIQFDIRTTDTWGVLVNADRIGSADIAFVFQDGSSSASEGTFTGLSIAVDGIVFSGNRDALHAMVADGGWHIVQVIGASAASAQSYWALGQYFNSHTASLVADIRNLKFDVGNTGTWDSQSINGDTNGWTRSGGTVFASDGDYTPPTAVTGYTGIRGVSKRLGT